MKKYLKYFCYLLFIFIFGFIFLHSSSINKDSIWNYGFSQAIANGLVPYKDFNTISTPLYIFIMSIGLFIKNSYTVYLIEQLLLIVLLFYIFYKIHNNKSIILIMLLCLPAFYPLLATYNFLVLLLLCLLILLENKKYNDYMIGLVLGLLILTKQTIGLPILFLSLLSTFNFKSIYKRLLGSSIPLFFFLVYLLITNSLYEFIDLCFLGLFDFGSKNGNLNIGTIVGLAFLIYVIYKIIKNPKEKKYYYALGSSTIMIPLFDFYHTYLFFIFLLFIDLEKVKLTKYKLICATEFIITVIFYFCFQVDFKNIRLLNIKHFETTFSVKEQDEYFNKNLKEYKKYDRRIMLSGNSMLFNIGSNNQITYFDMILNGNYGYDGTNKMIDRLNKLEDTFIFVDMYDYKYDDGQFNKEIVKYVIDNFKLIRTSSDFSVYYKE